MPDSNSLGFRLRRKIRQWQTDDHNQKTTAVLNAAVASHAAADPAAQPVVFFHASTRLERMNLNNAFQQLAAWGVQLAGTPVIHLVCSAGLKPCLLGTNRDAPWKQPPCEKCLALSDRLTAGGEAVHLPYLVDQDLEQALQKLELREYPDFVYDGLPLGDLVLPSLRWILRRHHLKDDGPTMYLFQQYMLSAWSLACQARDLLDRRSPRAVVVFNGMFYPEATVRFLAQQRDIPVISHEVALRPDTAFFTPGEATAYPIHIPEDFELNAGQNARLDAYLEQRLKGNFSMAGVRFWPEMQNLSPELLEKAAGFRQIVPVFTNVVFDTSQKHSNVVFLSMFEWLDEVLGLVKSHPDTLFVLRAHPDENRPGKEAAESVAGWVKQNRVDELDNLLFISPDEYLSSYELIQRSKFVMIYNSTIGLEAAIMGAPVLCGGRARFTQLPTVFFPQTRLAFGEQARAFLAADRVTAPPEFQQNARRFLYYQLYRTAIPMDQFIEPDDVWRGYVRWKSFDWQNLRMENSPAIRTIVNGILNQGDFIYDA